MRKVFQQAARALCVVSLVGTGCTNSIRPSENYDSGVFVGNQRDLLELISRTDKNYIFVGDGNHSKRSVMTFALSPEFFDALNAAGVRTVVLEQDARFQPALDDFATGKISKENFIAHILTTGYGRNNWLEKSEQLLQIDDIADGLEYGFGKNIRFLSVDQRMVIINSFPEEIKERKTLKQQLVKVWERNLEIKNSISQEKINALTAVNNVSEAIYKVEKKIVDKLLETETDKRILECFKREAYASISSICNDWRFIDKIPPATAERKVAIIYGAGHFEEGRPLVSEFGSQAVNIRIVPDIESEKLNIESKKLTLKIDAEKKVEGSNGGNISDVRIYLELNRVEISPKLCQQEVYRNVCKRMSYSFKPLLVPGQK